MMVRILLDILAALGILVALSLGALVLTVIFVSIRKVLKENR